MCGCNGEWWGQFVHALEMFRDGDLARRYPDDVDPFWIAARMAGAPPLTAQQQEYVRGLMQT